MGNLKVRLPALRLRMRLSGEVVSLNLTASTRVGAAHLAQKRRNHDQENHSQSGVLSIAKRRDGSRHVHGIQPVC